LNDYLEEEETRPRPQPRRARRMKGPDSSADHATRFRPREESPSPVHSQGKKRKKFSDRRGRDSNPGPTSHRESRGVRVWLTDEEWLAVWEYSQNKWGSGARPKVYNHERRSRKQKTPRPTPDGLWNGKLILEELVGPGEGNHRSKRLRFSESIRHSLPDHSPDVDLPLEGPVQSAPAEEAEEEAYDPILVGREVVLSLGDGQGYQEQPSPDPEGQPHSLGGGEAVPDDGSSSASRPGGHPRAANRECSCGACQPGLWSTLEYSNHRQ
jgi:hypothetical protein